MNLQNIQIDILTKTMADLIRENAELRAALIILQKEKEASDNGEHQDSTTDRTDNNC